MDSVSTSTTSSKILSLTTFLHLIVPTMKTKKRSKEVTSKKVRGKYNNYKDEEGQKRVKQAIETFLQRREQDSKASLRAFASEVDIKYETLKPFCREDLSRRKRFVVVGQTKLIPEAEMDAFCKRMILEQKGPDLDRAYVISAFREQFSNIDKKKACNQYDRIVKKKCEAMKGKMTVLLDENKYETVLATVSSKQDMTSLLNEDELLAAVSLVSLGKTLSSNAKTVQVPASI